jgi:ABC-2 type transport system ATP-binding protein
MNKLLELKAVRKQFAGFLLNDISLSLPKGYIMGLVGPNGAGKTTIIQLILNMLKRDGGEILVLGKDNIKYETAIKQEVGIVFDSSIYVDAWTVRDTEKAVSIFYKDWEHDTFVNMVSRFELPWDKKVKDLSRGMQMKLMLACAFSHNAKLLILDEPTSGLDPVTRDELLEILQDYIANGERSVLFSTHITTDLERVADYVTLLNNGELFYSGSMEDLKAAYRLIKGNPHAISPELEKNIVGIRRTAVGFEGLIGAADATGATGAANCKDCMVEPATIDDIVIYVSKANKERAGK